MAPLKYYRCIFCGQNMQKMCWVSLQNTSDVWLCCLSSCESSNWMCTLTQAILSHSVVKKNVNVNIWHPIHVGVRVTDIV